jgi:hypothetical protein
VEKGVRYDEFGVLGRNLDGVTVERVCVRGIETPDALVMLLRGNVALFTA